MRAKEFIEEAVVKFPTGGKRAHGQPDLSDDEKYNMAVADQQGADHTDPAYDPAVARDMARMGGNDDEEMLRVLRNAGLHKDNIDEYNDSPEKAITEPWIIISSDGQHIYPNPEEVRGFTQVEAEKMAAELGRSQAVPLKQALNYIQPGPAYDSAKSFLQDYTDSTFSENVEEGNLKNANALVGSGLADPHGKKTNSDSKAHKSVRTPTTTYSKDRKKYNNGAPPGANDGFVGG